MRKLKAYDLLLDALEAKNIKIKFQIDPSISASANFDCKYNSISFVATNAISVSLPEELVHALQYNVLYGEAMAKGNTDYRFTMEWEANIFVDAARILQENYYYKTGYNTLTNASIELREGHKALMTSILETGYFSQTKHYEKFAEGTEEMNRRYITSFQLIERTNRAVREYMFQKNELVYIGKKEGILTVFKTEFEGESYCRIYSKQNLYCIKVVGQAEVRIKRGKQETLVGPKGIVLKNRDVICLPGIEYIFQIIHS